MPEDIQEGTHGNMIAEITHVRKVGNSLYLLLPRSSAEALKWRNGQLVQIYVYRERALVARVTLDLPTNLADYEKRFAADKGR